MSQADLIKLMKTKAEAVQAVVREVDSLQAVFDYTVALTRQQAGTAIAACGFDPPRIEPLARCCRDAQLTLLKPPFDPPLNSRSNANYNFRATEFHTALTPVAWGIAETGTLVLDSRSEELRLATMLSTVHVAILPADRIKPDSAALEQWLGDALAQPQPAYTAFITGPSRTADIERVLAIGVHGPRELHIMILTEATL